jgi:RNA polymerase sigma factor (TIGR02999 family)
MEAGEITRQLIAVRDGERQAMDRLFELVYERLHRIAHGQLGGRRSRVTLDTTALVHEAYLKLVDQNRVDWRDRNHFFAVSARAMRQILVDHVRGRLAQKRGAGARHTELDESRVGFEGRVVDLLALDDALRKLEELSERLCRVVELRFFAGLSVDEIAGVTGVTSRTVKRDWRKARAFLFSKLEPQPES